MFDLENLLDTALSAVLPSKSEVLYSLKYEWSKSVTVGIIPITVCSIKIDAYLKYFHAITITYGFEEGALFIGVGPEVGCSLGLRGYVDLLVLRAGVGIEGTLIKGALDFKLGI